MRAMAPTSLVAKIQSGYIDFQWKGDTRLLKTMADQVPPGVDPDGSVTAARWEVACCDAIMPQRKNSRSVVGQRNCLQHRRIDPENLLRRLHIVAYGDNATGQKALEQARPALEAAMKEA